MDGIHYFFQYGTQYYVVGRYAAFAGQTPIVGNLMHHAIEMFLKGALSKSMTAEQMKNNLKHDLPKIWSTFKQQFADPSLHEFDAIIATLNDFEDIRYPDLMMAKGAALVISIVKETPVIPEFQGGQTVPQYTLCLPDIDELVAAIFKAASRNSKAYFTFTKPEATEFLNRDNAMFKV